MPRWQQTGAHLGRRARRAAAHDQRTRHDVGVATQDHLKVALRAIVGPFLRGQGFKGSGATWRLTASNGDVAVLNVQSSQFSSVDDLRCVINMSIVPVPWWDWQRERMSYAGSAAPKERDGLWRERLHPAGAPTDFDVWWQMVDEQSSAEAALEMVSQLEHEGLPTLRQLLDRVALMASIRRADLGFLKGRPNRYSFDRALAMLLADDGPSPELDELLVRLNTDPGDGRGEATRALTDLVRARADSRR